MITLMLVAALQANSSPSPSNPLIRLSQTKLDGMSDACHAPRIWLKQLGGDQVRFQPSPKGQYAKVSCVLKRLQRSAYPMKLGFIGNEAASMDDGHK
jgi:hypothetical protein